MNWTYEQSTGKLIGPDQTVYRGGYSGHGDGVNNHALETVVGVGPIPLGEYAIGPWIDHHPRLGPLVAPLTPVGHNAHGRTEFFTHGDNSAANHSASHGCIIEARLVRQAMHDSGVTKLIVV